MCAPGKSICVVHACMHASISTGACVRVTAASPPVHGFIEIKRTVRCQQNNSLVALDFGQQLGHPGGTPLRPLLEQTAQTWRCKLHIITVVLSHNSGFVTEVAKNSILRPVAIAACSQLPTHLSHSSKNSTALFISASRKRLDSMDCRSSWCTFSCMSEKLTRRTLHNSKSLQMCMNASVVCEPG